MTWNIFLGKILLNEICIIFNFRKMKSTSKTIFFHFSSHWRFVELSQNTLFVLIGGWNKRWLPLVEVLNNLLYPFLLSLLFFFHVFFYIFYFLVYFLFHIVLWIFYLLFFNHFLFLIIAEIILKYFYSDLI